MIRDLLISVRIVAGGTRELCELQHEEMHSELRKILSIYGFVIQ